MTDQPMTPAEAQVLLQGFADVQAWMAHHEPRLRALAAQASKLPPTVAGVDPKGIDALVAQAKDATGVQKALELSTGRDRRTLYGWAERLVKIHGLSGPQYQLDNVAFWKYLAERNASGQHRLVAATLNHKANAEVAA